MSRNCRSWVIVIQLITEVSKHFTFITGEIFGPRSPSVGAHLAFLPSCNTVAFLLEDDDICI